MACSLAGTNGGAQNAMMASPMYLSMLPPLRLIGSDITVKYLLITATSAFGLKP